MTKTVITLTAEMDTTSLSRVGALMDDVALVFKQHKTRPATLVISQGKEAYDDRAQADGTDGGDVGRARAEAGKRAAEDFPAEDEPDAAPEQPVKRGRGRPRKSDAGSEAGSGPSAGSEQRGKRAEGRAEAADGDEPVRTRKGTGEGSDEGEGRGRGAGRSGDDQRGNRGTARVSTGEDRGEAADEDWDDAEPEEKPAPRRSKKDEDDDGPEHHAKVPDRQRKDGTTQFVWPDHLMPEDKITSESLSALLAEHFSATGGKDRSATFAIMEDATGVRKMSEVDPRDYDNLAAGLLKDIARHKYGIKPSRV